MKNINEILEKVSAEHPYKVYGDRDSYSQYNEAWQDCIARIEQEMDLMQQENRFEFNFSGVKAFDCQCGRRYVNTDGWILVNDRLPENNEEVIAQWEFYSRCDNMTYTYIQIMRFDKMAGEWKGQYGIPNGRVIAWRPLPAPYRKEG